MAGLQVVVVSDPGLNERILRARPEGFGRLPTVAPVFREMGVEGVFSAEGAAWRPQRRLAMQALAPRHLRGFYPVLVTIAERLRERWRRAVEAGVEIDLLDDLKRFTVDVTTLLTLGRDLDTLGRDEDVIQRHLEHLMPAFNRRLFALLPTWRWLPLPADRRLDRALKALHAWLAEVIAEARQRLVAHPQPEPANFLEAMLTARDERDRPFSDLEIAGNLLTMLLAGEDTTAYTLAWAVHHLCEAPAAVAALRAELDEALGPAAVPPTLEVANGLAWAGAAANETMRLRPVAPLIGLEALRDTVVGDVRVPAGTGIYVLSRPPAVDARHFERADEFLPERWLGGLAGAHEPSAHIPFGSGPRLCPGRTLALLEMKVALATLYKSFEVERTAPAAAVEERFAFTMYPQGIALRLRPRE